MSNPGGAARRWQSSAGSSILFVLAAMMLLMAVGASTLVAAGAAARAGSEKQTSTQADLYADSVHRAIKQALEDHSLGDQLLRAMYTARKSGESSFTVNLAPTISVPSGTAPDIGAVGIMRMVVNSAVIITDRVEERTEPLYDWEGNPVYELDEDNELVLVDGNPVQKTEYIAAIPEKASVNAAVTVSVPVTVRGRSAVYEAKYSFEGGFLEAGDITSTGSGNWRVVSYEKIAA